MWASIGTAYGIGCEAKVNKIAKNDLAGNWLTSLTLGFPIDRKQGVKVSLLVGRTQKPTGVDIDSVVFTYSLNVLGWKAVRHSRYPLLSDLCFQTF